MKISLVIIALAVAPFLLFVLMSFYSRKNLSWSEAGVDLFPCPKKDNCVCSKDASGPYGIAPFSFEGDGEAAMKKLASLLASQPRTQIVDQRPGYLRAECQTLIFRFIDDLEFLLSEKEKTIHVRSASRVGHSDFGVNRARVEKLRKLFFNQ